MVIFRSEKPFAEVAAKGFLIKINIGNIGFDALLPSSLTILVK
jgi:hypothetical protein